VELEEAEETTRDTAEEGATGPPERISGRNGGTGTAKRLEFFRTNGVSGVSVLERVDCSI
jgi:hypothetical protein